MTNIIKVIGVVVDTQQATFYKENGETVVILQGDTRLANLIRTVTPILANGNGAVAEIDLDAYPENLDNPFNTYEERSSGLVKFFRIAKSKLAAFFSNKEEQNQPIEEMSLGVSSTTPIMSAMEDIMAHAVPVKNGINRTALEATEESVAETIIAVVGENIIPDAHKLEQQFKRSNEQTHTVGMQKFMERIAVVAGKRSHSVQDLMRFMERGDLPVAEDGSIVIYKILKKRSKSAHPGFTYVDCHSGNVPQRVGSYVHMDESLVDPNRRNECSNGLHVARRGYLAGFSGDVVTICKVRPEDVIAVPDYDANKMRVCGYHIVSELPSEDFDHLRCNNPIKTEAGKKLLAQALSGNHPPPDSDVLITQQTGGGIVISNPVQDVNVDAVAVVMVVKEIEATILDTNPEANVCVELVDVRNLSDEVTETVATGKTRAELAKDLFKIWKAAPKGTKQPSALALKTFKRSKKIGWDRLGISEKDGKAIEKDAG
jgi:hypothetical protein